MTTFLEITPVAGGYSVLIHSGTPERGRTLPSPVSLGPNVTVPLGQMSATLAELTTAIRHPHCSLHASRLDRRAQEKLGQFLWDTVFGVNAEEAWQRLQCEGGDIRIVTSDEHIASLPWALMGQRGQHAVLQRGSMVSLATPGPTDRTAGLPPLPKLLFAIPEPLDCEPTNGQGHVRAIEAVLQHHSPRYDRDDRLRVVTRWQEFQHEASTFQPDLVYFYGHGEGDDRSATLLFEDDSNRTTRIPIADFAATLRHDREKAPTIVYVNACHGADFGYLGVGWQLAPSVPIVLSNCTVAIQATAQAQATAFLKSVLVCGDDPVAAVGEMYRSYLKTDTSSGTIHWAAPVLYCRADGWESSALDPNCRSAMTDTKWRFKLDRVTQFGTVRTQVEDMMRSEKLRFAAYGWYGGAGQGVKILLDRLRAEFIDRLPDTGVKVLCLTSPPWPGIVSTEDFERMVLETFEVNHLNQIPSAIRNKTRHHEGPRTLIYIRHDVIHGSAHVMRPDAVKRYVEFWSTHVAPRLPPHTYALLGLGFTVTHGEKFLKAMDQRNLRSYYLPNGYFELLKELLPVEEDDIVKFIHHQDAPIPCNLWQSIARQIIQRTHGNYEATIEELDKVILGHIDQFREEAAVPELIDEY